MTVQNLFADFKYSAYYNNIRCELEKKLKGTAKV